MNVFRLLLSLTFVSFVTASQEPSRKRAQTMNVSRPEGTKKFKGLPTNLEPTWVSLKAKKEGLTVEQRSAKIVAAKLATKTPVVSQDAN